MAGRTGRYLGAVTSGTGGRAKRAREGRLRAVCRLADLEEGRGRMVEIDGKCLAIFRLATGGVFALDNACPHREGPLACGDLRDTTIYCPVHAWPVDLTTGRCRDVPGAAVRIYPVRLEGDSVWIEL